MTTKMNLARFLSTFDDTTPAPPAPAGVPASPPPAGLLDERAVAALVAQATAQASAATLQEIERRAREEEAAEAARAEQEQLQAQLASTDADERYNALLGQFQQMQQQLRQSELNTFRANAIAQARASGNDLVDGMVYGNSEAEITQRVAAACQEYRMMEQRIREQVMRSIPQGTTTAASPTAAAQVAQQPLGSPGYAAPVSAQPAPQNQGVLTPEQYSYLLSPQAVRNGDYAKYRHLVFQHMANVANAPAPTVQPPVSYSPAIPQQPPMPVGYGTLPGGVQVPVMRPQGPVYTQPPAYPQPGYGAAPAGYFQQPPGFIPQPQPAFVPQGQPGISMMGMPQQAPQPAQIDAALQQGQHVQIDGQAALTAALAAVNRARAANANRPGVNHHGQ
jgi:hypothetical protein